MTRLELIKRIDEATLRHRDRVLRERAARQAVRESMRGRGALFEFAAELARAEAERLVKRGGSDGA